VARPIEDEDFLIRIRPTYSAKGEWSGDAEVSVITSENNELTEEVYRGMELFVKMLLSSLPVMEQDEYVRETIYKYCEEYVGELFTLKHEEDEQEVIITRDEENNVVHLTFSTTTKGEA
tara:strand:- start:1868 stop:2224 length:357 start_codon:yes stop_codon:yes gene_type:complete